MYPQLNPILDIDRRIEDLQKLKNNYQNMPHTQPINIYNNANGTQNDFKAQYLNENEKVEDILVQTKTCFIDLKNRQITIKEINGDTVQYEIVIPKTEEQLKIEELERKVNEYEQLINATNEKSKPKCNASKSNDE